jgi:hypothetical protein
MGKWYIHNIEVISDSEEEEDVEHMKKMEMAQEEEVKTHGEE